MKIKLIKDVERRGIFYGSRNFCTGFCNLKL